MCTYLTWGLSVPLRNCGDLGVVQVHTAREGRKSRAVYALVEGEVSLNVECLRAIFCVSCFVFLC